MVSVQHRTAFVTGGGSGIGKQICHAFAAEGYRLAIFDRDETLASQTADELAVEALVFCGNVTDEIEVRRAVEAAAAHFGSLDVGVNAAGVGASSLLVDTSLESWNRVMDVCLTGVFVSARAQAVQMMRQRSGVIINIVSTNAQQAGEGLAAYCAAKAGVEMLTKVAALELAEHGIRVLGVGPGLTETPMVSRFLENPAARQAFLSGIALGRPADPGEIASAVLFLASEAASYITGQTLYVDGGALLKSYPSLAARSGR